MVAWIRRFLIFFPAALLLLVVASFLVVKGGSRKRLNQLTIGGIGEAENLNPILATTTAASEVGQFLFNSLIRYDENLNLQGELARDWSLAQTSTIFFRTPGQASSALARLEASKKSWPEWKLAGARVDGSSLMLRLTEAGRMSPDRIQALFNPKDILPVTALRVDTKGRAVEFSKGGAIREAWKDGTLGWELVVVGEPDTLIAEIKGNHPEPSEEVYVVPSIVETTHRLDEPEIHFRLREGIRWHDGAPFTAEDVEFTYRMLMSEEIASPRRSDYELIKRVEVIDPLSVKVVYRRPYSPCLNSWMMPLLPRHLLDGKKRAWWAENFDRKPVGTGPFKFGGWRVNQYVRLVKNEDYFEGSPHLDAVVIRSIPDPVTLRLSFETREVDYWGIEPHAIRTFQKDPRFDFFATVAPVYDYVGWNLKREMFKDVRVRRALAHAVNVPQIIEFVRYGFGRQSRGIFPPMMWFANPDIQLLEYDPEKAAQLLDEAGWKRGPDGIRTKNGQRFSFKLITNQANEVRKDIATLVQSDLKKLGIDVDVQIFEWAVFITKYINKLDFDATVLGWQTGYDYDQYQIWHSTQAKPDRLNHVSYMNPRVDELLEAARSEFDPGKVKLTCWELERIIYNDQPYLFLVVPDSTAAMWKDTFVVERPGPGESWVEEPVRATKAGFRYYIPWWKRIDLGMREGDEL